LSFLTGLEIFHIIITDIELTDHSLQKLFISLPPRCMVLLEDVNPTQLRRNNNTDTEDAKKKGVSLSDIVTAIDGPLTCEGPILIITTNFRKDDFPEELIRPGRIDSAFEFKKATENEALKLFQIIYSHYPRDQLKEYGEKFSRQLKNMREYEFSPAELQGFFLMVGTPQDATKTFGNWVERERKKAGGHELTIKLK
jgi:chaperone BCS1